MPLKTLCESGEMPCSLRDIGLSTRRKTLAACAIGNSRRVTGFTLSDHARLRQDWWANADADGEPSPQSRSWIHASRTAVANLVAQSVVFEREVR